MVRHARMETEIRSTQVPRRTPRHSVRTHIQTMAENLAGLRASARTRTQAWPVRHGPVFRRGFLQDRKRANYPGGRQQSFGICGSESTKGAQQSRHKAGTSRFRNYRRSTLAVRTSRHSTEGVTVAAQLLGKLPQAAQNRSYRSSTRPEGRVPPADTLDEAKAALAETISGGQTGEVMGRRARSSARGSACNPTISGAV